MAAGPYLPGPPPINVGPTAQLGSTLLYKCQIKRLTISWAEARGADLRRRVRTLQHRLQVISIPTVERNGLRSQLQAINSQQQQDKELRANTLYQQLNDRPTAAFFSGVGKASAYRPITALTMPDQSISEVPSVIREEVARFWGEVFGEHQDELVTAEGRAARETSLGRIHKKLSQDQQEKLNRPMTIPELEGVVKHVTPGKCPGEDGLPIEFYKATWEFTGPILQLLATGLQRGEEWPAECVHANVALIPKTEQHAPVSSKFRPIALLNVDYKIIAGAVARRIAGVLQLLVDELQTGFVPGRFILENITFNRDLLDYCETTQSPLLMAFLDFEKAFDRVSWSFRDEVMETMGFPPTILNLVRGLYANANCEVIVNGEKTRPIKQTRGVRQGCPLSPVLFALFAEPLGLLLRSLEKRGQGRPKCGVLIPRVYSGGKQRRVGSQFADDTTVYATTHEAMQYTMFRIRAEFCVASGAKLNESKSRTLCAGGGEVPVAPLQQQQQQQQQPTWRDLEVVQLHGDETIRSLGAVYGEHVDPADRFDAILEKIQSRMSRWQARFPSLIARVTISNALLASCMWFFCYFSVPKVQQLKTFDAIVWGMVWGKNSGDTGTRGLISKYRMAQPRANGGLGVLIPSTMIRALRVNMVNRALLDAGRWWTPFFHHWCEIAGGGFFRGADGLLQPSHNRLKRVSNRVPSTFWREALKDWGGVRYVMPAEGGHREEVGATPLLDMTTPRKLQGRADEVCRLFQRSNLLYLGDFWNFSALKWCSEEAVLQMLEPHQEPARIPASRLRNRYRHLIRSFTRQQAQAVDALATNRVQANPPDGPVVGEIWADPTTSPVTLGRVVEVDPSQTGPVNQDGDDRDACPCKGKSGGSCTTIALAQHDGGYGPEPPTDTSDAVQVVVCSCVLSPTHTGQGRMYGPVTLTRLSPPALTAPGPEGPTGTPRPVLTLLSPTRQLRKFFLYQMTPSQHVGRPPAERKWVAELALHNQGTVPYDQAKSLSVDEMKAAIENHPGDNPILQRRLVDTSATEWGMRWESINQLKVSGPIRSFLFKLTHRRLFLLSQSWLAGHYSRSNTCLLCSDSRPESYSHLFSDCQFAARLWASVDSVTQALGGSLDVDQRPARLVGDLTTFSVQRLRDAWAQTLASPPPAYAKVAKWLRRAWGETRAMVLKTIWEARCDILHNNVESQIEAAAPASSRLKQRICSIVYRRTPSNLPLSPSVLATSALEQNLNQITWGTVSDTLLLDRHITPVANQVPDPPEEGE